jgi:hypothetical protein
VGTALRHGIEHLGTAFRPNIPPVIEDSKCGPHAYTALFEREDLGRSGTRSLGVTPPNINIIGFVRTIPGLAQRSQEVVGDLAPGIAEGREVTGRFAPSPCAPKFGLTRWAIPWDSEADSEMP